MATGATGTPTAKGLPTINANADAPDGSGITSLAQAVDTLADKCQFTTDTPTTGEVAVWNGTAFAYSKIDPNNILQDGAATGEVLIWTGSEWAPGSVDSVLNRVTTPVDVVSTAAETTVFSYSVPGNTLGTNKMLRLTMFGDALHNNAGGDMLQVRFKLGGTTMVGGQTDMGAVTSGTREGWRMVFEVANLGVTNSQLASIQSIGVFMTGGNTLNGLGSVDERNRNWSIVSNSPTIDTTTSQTLLVSAQWSASASTNSWRMQYATLELV